MEIEVTLTTSDDHAYYMASIDGKRVSLEDAKVIADDTEESVRRLRQVIADAHALDGVEYIDLAAAVAKEH